MAEHPYRSTLPQSLQRIYFLWQWLVLAPFTVVNLLVLGPAIILAGKVREDAAFGLAQLWTRLVCLVGFTRLRTHGAGNARPGQGYVIMTNHQSAMDFSLIVGIPIPLRYVMKAELSRVPLFGWACTAAGTVWIDRSDRAKAIDTLAAMAPKLERGVSLQIFPEGTRSKDGSIGPFKKGGFMLALELGVPILPVTISGSGRIWPTGTMRLLPGTIDYIIHPPIDVTAYGVERRDELMEAVRAALQSGLGEGSPASVAEAA